jgi:hypothetical protein
MRPTAACVHPWICSKRRRTAGRRGGEAARRERGGQGAGKHLLQLLQAVADDTPGRTAEVAGEGTPPLLGAVNLGEGANPGALTHVEPARQRRCCPETGARAEPVSGLPETPRHGAGARRSGVCLCTCAGFCFALTAADEEPVLVVGGKFPGDRGLHEVHELGERDLALLLEVHGIALHELVSIDILHGDAGLLKARLLSDSRHCRVCSRARTHMQLRDCYNWPHAQTPRPRAPRPALPAIRHAAAAVQPPGLRTQHGGHARRRAPRGTARSLPRHYPGAAWPLWQLLRCASCPKAPGDNFCAPFSSSSLPVARAARAAPVRAAAVVESVFGSRSRADSRTSAGICAERGAQAARSHWSACRPRPPPACRLASSAARLTPTLLAHSTFLSSTREFFYPPTNMHLKKKRDRVTGTVSSPTNRS